MTTTIFLRQPSGVAIETDDVRNWESVLQASFTVTVTRRRDGATLVVPVDNIASVEIR